jgi:hypothetical protein
MPDNNSKTTFMGIHEHRCIHCGKTPSEAGIAKCEPIAETALVGAIEAGVEAAAEYVSEQPPGADKSWGSKEYRIAETAAMAAASACIKALFEEAAHAK